MAKYNDKTARGWPLPHRENRLYDDVERLRETLNLVDTALTAIESHEGVIEGRQDSLSTRLDTILEGATEDAEILDARVDAKDTVHPNLGHNIRNLHRLILELNDAVTYEDSEIKGLARQFGSVAEAQIQYELNEQEAHQRRKREILQEILTRSEHDEELHRQVNSTSEGLMRLALMIQEVAQKRRDDSARLDNKLHTEINSLDGALRSEIIDVDEHLQAEINALAESCLRDTMNLYDAIEHRKSALKQETEARKAKDAELQSQISENARKIQQEEDDISAEIWDRQRADDSEIQARVDGDLGLAQQADSNAEANIRNTLYIQDINARRKADLTREEQARFEEDSGIQSQANTNAEAVMRNALNIQEEADKRRKLLARLIEEKHDREHAIQNLRAEIGTLYEIPLPGLHESLSGLQEQSDKNAQAEILNALNLHEEAEQRRGISNRIEAVIPYFQRQIDELLHAILENAVNLLDTGSALQSQTDSAAHGILRNTLLLSKTLSRQREALKQEVIARMEQDAGILSQVKSLALADVQQMLNTASMNAERRHEESQERQARVEQDNGLQEQMNQLAFANMWLAVNEHETHKKVSNIETDITMIPGRAATDDEFDELLDDLYND